MSAEYFKIDTNSRAPFQYGICLYLCWGTMIIYGVGASLYTFSGKLIVSGQQAVPDWKVNGPFAAPNFLGPFTLELTLMNPKV